MSSRSKTVEARVGDKVIALTNLDKVLYPEAGFTKAQVIDYYTRIAPAILPHLKDRPLTLKRYPNGVDAPFFYEKNCPKHRPPWFQTTPVWSDGNKRFMDFCVCSDLPSLVWLAQLATIELHTSLSLGSKIEEPQFLVFDLDPGPPATIVQCCQVGLWVRGIFEGHGLRSFPKTSGSKGLQVYVPLNAPGVTYQETKGVARALAAQLEREHPNLVVSRMDKALRPNKVFIDWSQNDQMKTTVSVYSLRARARPTVSTPLTWDEVENAHRKADPNLLVFEAGQAIERFEKLGDLFEPVLKTRQKLPSGVA